VQKTTSTEVFAAVFQLLEAGRKVGSSK